MKTKILTLLLIVISCSLLAEEKKPLKVVIVGAGPAGLATAIEARAIGADVTVIEKRTDYTRIQWLFLQQPSLNSLEKWKIEIPDLSVAEIEIDEKGTKEKVGFVDIKTLEQHLEKKAKDLGVKKILGDFKEISNSDKSVVISSNNQLLTLPYEILIGAEGTHSKVRTALGIENTQLGIAHASLALIPCTNTERTDITPAISINGSFLRKISLPTISLIFSQNNHPFTKEEFQNNIQKCGWHKESAVLKEGKALVVSDIEVRLQQAKTFFNQPKSAIIVGDAAATASFFEGRGANTALATAEIAGAFFKDYKNADAFAQFNRRMQQVTSEMIENSRYLFEEK